MNLRRWMGLLVLAVLLEVALARLLAGTDVLAAVLVGTRLDLLGALLVLLTLRLSLVLVAPGWVLFVLLRALVAPGGRRPTGP
jgi:uncharacterized Tic20 family protein